MSQPPCVSPPEGVISIRGARQHNLQNVDLDLPRDRIIVITGVSGSGKSSLAFDTLFAEGQRRYVESLSPRARQSLEQMQKPEVMSVHGLPPTLSIDQRSRTTTPRSTVGTATEINDYLRVLFARAGVAHCPRCDREVRRKTAAEVVETLLQLPPETRLMVLGPVVRGRRGSHQQIFKEVRRRGFVRVRADSELCDLREIPNLEPRRRHDIEVVVDRLAIRPAARTRLAEAVEMAYRIGDGRLLIYLPQEQAGENLVFTERYACTGCDIQFPEFGPRLFSFNSPHGACPACDGLGTCREFDPDLMVSEPLRSLESGALDIVSRLGKSHGARFRTLLKRFSELCGVPLSQPFERMDEAQKRLLFEGSGRNAAPARESFDGLLSELRDLLASKPSTSLKRKLQTVMSDLPCPDCGGTRLRAESRAVRIGKRSIAQVTSLTIEQAVDFFESLELEGAAERIAAPLLREIRSRLRFLLEVGVGYLTLDRRSATLSGGEAQRIRLASQLGSGLVGVCYVLDEPTIGLHPRDTSRLLSSLKRLRDLGNTVVVVEHDEETIRQADYLVDMGPAAGREGGQVVAAGPLPEVLEENDSQTIRYLTGETAIDTPSQRRPVDLSEALTLEGARENNLHSIDVHFPLGCFTCVTGVSGSGKSTLVDEILYKALCRKLHGSKEKPGAHARLLGVGQLDKVVVIDQSPIGRSPRSNPATYTGLFDELRKLFAMTKEARIRGYTPGRFSFNTRGGRCEACEGQGTKLIEMHLLPDLYVVCEVCRGSRYNRETLEVRYRGHSIADVLRISVDEAARLFRNFPKPMRMLEMLQEVGLGYLTLGQPSHTLSGGEAQRIKLGRELSRVETGRTVYLLDEPTTGLHFADIQRLLDVLNRLVDKGNTIVVIEHNPHVLKAADYLIDLGPEGGERGGEVILSGTPEEIAAHPSSHTGRYLRPHLLQEQRV